MREVGDVIAAGVSAERLANLADLVAGRAERSRVRAQGARRT
jgi:hypothetical protein